MSDFTVAYDGNLVSEISVLLELYQDSLVNSNFDAYTCRVRDNIRFECLDVASSAILQNSLNSSHSYTDQSSTYSSNLVNLYDIASSTITENTNLFGSQCGGKIVGDGMINSFDLWVFAMSYFSLAPYNNLNMYSTVTVNGRDDTKERCNSGNTFEDYLSDYNSNACTARRRLDESKKMNLKIFTHQIFKEGRWVRIEIPHIYWSLEIHFKNLFTKDYIPLSHAPYSAMHISKMKKISVHYNRHLKYERRCAMIIASIFGNVAMLGNSLSLAQYGENPCSYDLFMWIPSTHKDPLQISGTSTGIDGFGGRSQIDTITELGIYEKFQAGIRADPHLYLAHGGKADVRGAHNLIYNLLSSNRFSLNAKFENSTFKLHNKTVYGSFVTEAFVKTEHILLSYKSFRSFKRGYISGSCKNVPFVLHSFQNFTCEDVSLQMNYFSLNISASEWMVMMRPKPIYNMIKGPRKRLDIHIENRVPQFNFIHKPHGLLGQSFDSDHIAVFGLIETFDTNPYTTHYMGEGAIEGNIDDYKVATPYSTQFTFSRFSYNGENRERRIMRGFQFNIIDK